MHELDCITSSNIKFHTNPSIGGRVQCGRADGRTDDIQTDRQTAIRSSKERHEMCQGDQEGALRLHDEERRKERQSHSQTDASYSMSTHCR